MRTTSQGGPSSQENSSFLLCFLTHRCWRLGSWKILAGMADRRLRFRRRTCRLLDRLEKQPVSSQETRLLFRNLEQKHPSGAARAQTERAPSRRHSQVLERQHGEGGGPEVGDGVVAEVQRLQGEEGPQLLREDARDPVVCSENTRPLR